MPPPLQVTAAGLRALGQQCQELAGQVAPTLSAASAAGWQATGTAAGTVDAGAGKTGTILAARLTADAAKLTRAADDYTATDEHGETALTGAGSRMPAGVGGDGGAGGMPATASVPLVPGSGIDGGAGGAGAFGAGR